MTTGYLCERCGTRWGVFVSTSGATEERKQARDRCIAETCLPIRQILNGHAVALRTGEITNAEEVIAAIEAQEARWRMANSAFTLSRDVEAALVPSPSSWPKMNEAIKAFSDIWIARWGPGSAPGDVLRNQLQVLQRAGAAYDAVRRSFERYVAVVEDGFASPYAWRKRWQSYDPETPEHDHEGAAIADSIDRQVRQRRRNGPGGMQHVGQALKRLR